MVDFGAPYALDGTVIPGSGLRRQLQQSAGSGSGVLRPGDLKITQMDTPGAGVKVAAGDDLIQCAAPGRDRETYGIPLYTAQNYLGDSGSGIPGTGSSVPEGGRRDMIFHEMLDPSLPTFYTPEVDWPVDATSKLSIVQDVGTARTVQEVSGLTNVTGYALAIVTYPASTATITDAMITDLRKVQSPRSSRVLRAVNLTGDPQKLSSTVAPPTGGETFPVEFTGEAGRIPVPLWATKARIVMTWGSVRFAATSTAAGFMWVQVGANVDPDVFRTQVASFDANPGSREVWVVADTKTIPAAMRGKDVWFFPRASLSASQTETNQPTVNNSSSMVLDVEFFEDAV